MEEENRKRQEIYGILESLTSEQGYGYDNFLVLSVILQFVKDRVETVAKSLDDMLNTIRRF